MYAATNPGQAVRSVFKRYHQSLDRDGSLSLRALNGSRSLHNKSYRQTVVTPSISDASETH